MSERRTRGQASFYNLVTAVTLILTLGVCLAVVFFARSADFGRSQLAEPTVFLIPSQTPTLKGPTPNATWTASPTVTMTFTPTITKTTTPTETPTVTATSTATNTPTITPTFTPSNTPTVTNTPQPTNTAPPTATQEVSNQYARAGSTVFTSNYANSAGCAWTGIAGQIFDVNGVPQNGVRVQVWNSDFTFIVVSGNMPGYGGDGWWEQFISNELVEGRWFVQVVDENGGPLSPSVTVNLKTNCSQNLAIVKFQQQ